MFRGAVYAEFFLFLAFLRCLLIRFGRFETEPSSPKCMKGGEVILHGRLHGRLHGSLLLSLIDRFIGRFLDGILERLLGRIFGRGIAVGGLDLAFSLAWCFAKRGSFFLIYVESRVTPR